MKPFALVERWRMDAATLTSYGGDALATALNRCANELEEALRESGDAVVNLTKAAEISGYTADHLGRLVRDGKIQNAGRENAPLIRVADLPKKPTLRVEEPADQLGARRIAESVTTRRKRRA